MTDSDAQEELRDVIPVLTDSWTQGWNDIRTTFHHAEWDSRCRSTVLQMQAVINAKRPLISLFGAVYHTRHSQHIFTIPGIAHIVFKQLKDDLLPHVNRTAHGNSFYTEESLEGLEDLPRLVCGAVASQDWTTLMGVFLTSPNRGGKMNNWELNITATPTSTDAKQTRFDFSPHEENTPQRKFIPKNEKHQGQRDTGTDDRTT